MRRLLIIMMLCFLCQWAWATDFRARVNRQSLYMGESFELVLTIDEGVQSPPNLSVLEKDFQIEAQQRSNQMTVVNGEAVTKTVWRIALFPKSEGTLIIPALTLNGMSTDPIKISVKPENELPQSAGMKAAFVEVSVKPKSDVYVGQEIRYTVKFYQAIPQRVASPSLSPPKAEGAVIQQLPGDKQYSLNIKGQDYRVYEIEFVIFPEQVGSLVIRPPVVTAIDLGAQQRRYQSLLDTRGNMLRMAGKSMTVEVLPEPPAMKSDWWIPAKSLAISESWSTPLDQLHVGEAVTRTVTIIAVGTRSTQLPSISFRSDIELNIYPDKPVMQNVIEDGEVKSSRVEKFAVIANQEGKITIPAIDVPWWNTVTGKREVATLPAKTINVLPSVGGAPVTAVPTQLSSILPAAEATSTSAPAPMALQESGVATWWFWAAVGFAVLWLATVVTWFVMSLQKRRIAAGRVKEKVDSERHRLKSRVLAIKKACAQNAPKEAEKAFVAFGQLYFPKKKPCSIATLATLLQDKQFSSAVADLETVLYKADAPWEGKPCWDAFEASIKTTTEKTKGTSSSSLPGLYD